MANNLEKKLAEYRAKKAREAKMNEIKAKTREFFAGLWKSREKSDPAEEAPLAPEDPEETVEDATSVCSDDDNINCCSCFDWLTYIFVFVLWLGLYVLFIKFGFGTVFLIVSALVFMFVNTRTGPRKKGEVSAYSVFNDKCKSIDGTLKAEQFEREIRYGPSVVK